MGAFGPSYENPETKKLYGTDDFVDINYMLEMEDADFATTLLSGRITKHEISNVILKEGFVSEVNMYNLDLVKKVIKIKLKYFFILHQMILKEVIT